MARLKVVGGAADLFSYAALSREDEADVRQVAERIKLRLRRTAEDIIEIGRDLTAMKEKLGHGHFLKWIEAEFDMSHTTATRFMNVADVFSDKSCTVQSLQPKALYELAAPSTPPEVRDQVEALVDGHEPPLARNACEKHRSEQLLRSDQSLSVTGCPKKTFSAASGGLSGISCAGGHTGPDGGSLWHDAKHPGYLTRSLTNYWLGRTRRRPSTPTVCSMI